MCLRGLSLMAVLSRRFLTSSCMNEVLWAIVVQSSRCHGPLVWSPNSESKYTHCDYNTTINHLQNRGPEFRSPKEGDGAHTRGPEELPWSRQTTMEPERRLLKTHRLHRSPLFWGLLELLGGALRPGFFSTKPRMQTLIDPPTGFQ